MPLQRSLAYLAWRDEVQVLAIQQNLQSLLIGLTRYIGAVAHRKRAPRIKDSAHQTVPLFL